jgi:hypothetical protein
MEKNETWCKFPCKKDYPNTVPMPHSEKILLDFYLESLFDSFLTEALGQDHHPLLQLVVQGNWPGARLCFLAMAFKIRSSMRYGLYAPVLKRINI